MDDTPGPPAGGADIAAMLAEFHSVLGQRFGDGGRSRELRAKLHHEENRELCEALDAGDRVSIAQELADVVYVAYGTAFSEGIDLDAVLREIHRANMSKRGPDGNFVLREDGKVLKGPWYDPPDIAAVLDGDGDGHDEKGRGPEYWRGVADGRLAERAGVTS